MKILYLTDPGLSNPSQLQLLGTFLADNSQRYKPGLVVVSGDYIELHEALKQSRHEQGQSEQEAMVQAGARRIQAYRPRPATSQQSFSFEQIPEVYAAMVKIIEQNTDVPVVLTPGNHDLYALRQSAQASQRVFLPEFAVQQISGLTIGSIPGSEEAVQAEPSPGYVWEGDMTAKFAQLMQGVIGTRHLDLLITHVPPRTYDLEAVLGYGTDRIPDWEQQQSTGVITKDGRHVGYPVIRELIRLSKPSLVLCGHIEEARHRQGTRMRSGAIDRIGQSMIVNPGAFYPSWFEPMPVGAVIDYHPGYVERVLFLTGDQVIGGIQSTPRREKLPRKNDRSSREK